MQNNFGEKCELRLSLEKKITFKRWLKRFLRINSYFVTSTPTFLAFSFYYSSQLRRSSELEGATIDPFLGKNPSDAYTTFTSSKLISVEDDQENVISYQVPFRDCVQQYQSGVLRNAGFLLGDDFCHLTNFFFNFFFISLISLLLLFQVLQLSSIKK